MTVIAHFERKYKQKIRWDKDGPLVPTEFDQAGVMIIGRSAMTLIWAQKPDVQP